MQIEPSGARHQEGKHFMPQEQPWWISILESIWRRSGHSALREMFHPGLLVGKFRSVVLRYITQSFSVKDKNKPTAEELRITRLHSWVLRKNYAARRYYRMMKRINGHA